MSLRVLSFSVNISNEKQGKSWLVDQNFPVCIHIPGARIEQELYDFLSSYKNIKHYLAHLKAKHS
jgi:hypothetical protein